MSFNLSQARTAVYAILAGAGFDRRNDNTPAQDAFRGTAFVAMGTCSKHVWTTESQMVEWGPVLHVFLSRPADQDAAVEGIMSAFDSVCAAFAAEYSNAGSCFIFHGSPIEMKEPIFSESGIEIQISIALSWNEIITTT